MKTMSRFYRCAMPMAVCLLLPFVSCTTDYVTGKKTFSLISESQEIEMGKEADPAIVAQYGLYDDPELAALVDELGQRLARVSQRPQLTYTFRVLDSPVVNAFALPGGYIYVTRGILAHFNSEDELGGVLGHELGHVVARHSAEQISRQQLAGIGLGVGAIVSEEFRKYIDVASASVGLLFLKFSRGQESESDMLGVEYSTKLGYDAHRMAGFFQTLDRMGEQSGQTIPSFLSTHPDPGDRENRVHELTDEWRGKVGYQPLRKNPADYLQKIDGLVYGDDPRQGFVESSTFHHPALRFMFPVPSGWSLVNTASTVAMMSGEKDALVQLTLGRGKTPGQEADEFLTKSGAAVRSRGSANVHGFSAVVIESDLTSEERTLRILSYFIQKGEYLYVFHGLAAAADYVKYAATFERVMTGFDELRDRAALEKKPKRVRIRAAPKSGDLAAVLETLGMPQEMHRELAILNGRRLDDGIQRGDKIKVVGE